MKITVMKFGGTSVQNAAAMKRVAQIVRDRIDQNPLVVVSALAGITQSLIEATRTASLKKRKETFRLLGEIAARHLQQAQELFGNSDRRRSMMQFTRSILREIRELLESILVLEEFTPRSLDRICGYGELLSSHLLEAYLEECGLDAAIVDARNVLITDRNFGNATPLIDFSLRRSHEILMPLIRHGRILVIQGFIGGTMDGIPTTLGRGASDDSAAIFGNLLDAEEIQIWTDVCGIMTADPRTDQNAKTIPKLSYSDAAALSAAGAKVLHVEAIHWAERKGIPIRILNTFEPQREGTLVGPDVFAVNNSRKRSAACE